MAREHQRATNDDAIFDRVHKRTQNQSQEDSMRKARSALTRDKDFEK
jgi:hypothetical protein